MGGGVGRALRRRRGPWEGLAASSADTIPGIEPRAGLHTTPECKPPAVNGKPDPYRTGGYPLVWQGLTPSVLGVDPCPLEGVGS